MSESITNEPMGGDGSWPCSRGCGADIGSPANQDDHNQAHLNMHGASDVFGMIGQGQSISDDDD